MKDQTMSACCLVCSLLLKIQRNLLLRLFLHLVVQSNNDVFRISFSDLDDTLYPLSTGINLACRKNIQGG